MTPDTRHTPPRSRDVLAAQLRVVGVALRRPALVAAGLIALTTALVALEFTRTGQPIDFDPTQQTLFGLLGLLLPMGVWMGEPRFGAGFMWTLPVDRRRHALARVLAGWAWLMGAVALLFVWLLALALLTGGRVLSEDTLRVLPALSSAPSPIVDPRAVQHVRWAWSPLFWLTPFTAASVAYVWASALALGVRHPLRWIVGVVLGVMLLVVVRNAANVALPFGDALRSLSRGPYGVDAWLTARTETLQVSATLSTGDRIVVWRALPDLGQWAVATLLWMGAGLAALAAAASRHRESRRA